MKSKRSVVEVEVGNFAKWACEYICGTLDRTPPQFMTSMMALWHLMRPDIRARAYHNVNHIMFMADTARRIGWGMTMPERLAIIFHDSVYTAQATDIPESFTMMKLLCPILIIKKIITHGDIDIAGDIIMSTSCTAGDRTCAKSARKVVQLDYAILAAGQKKYDEYAKNVIKEYLAWHPEKSLAEAYNLRNRFLVELPSKNIFPDMSDADWNGIMCQNIHREREILLPVVKQLHNSKEWLDAKENKLRPQKGQKTEKGLRGSSRGRS
jgi:predicted metal-dependent HD superfamily phosphohydrolase